MKILNRRNIILFAVVFAITLAVRMPAALLDGWLRQATGGTVRLASVEGTVWHGAAIPVLYLPKEPPLPLQRLEWEVSFRSLLSGGIVVRVRASAAPQQPAEIFLGFGRIELHNLAVELPAAAIGELNPMLQAMHFQGRLSVSTGSLAMQRNGTVAGDLSATWQMAGSALSPVNPFGNYRFDMNGAGDKVQINLSTISGDLQLNGQGVWLTSGKLNFQATARATGPGKDAYGELLHHLGPETEPGVFLFKIGS